MNILVFLTNTTMEIKKKIIKMIQEKNPNAIFTFIYRRGTLDPRTAQMVNGTMALHYQVQKKLDIKFKEIELRDEFNAQYVKDDLAKLSGDSNYTMIIDSNQLSLAEHRILKELSPKLIIHDNGLVVNDDNIVIENIKD